MKRYKRVIIHTQPCADLAYALYLRNQDVVVELDLETMSEAAVSAGGE
jgi:hypothetical protein